MAKIRAMAKKLSDEPGISRQNRVMSFWDHIEELRLRAIKIIGVFIVAACLFYTYLEPCLAYLLKPVGRLIFTSPAEAFQARILLTLWGGFFFSLPFTIYQVWGFIETGLRDQERKYVFLFGPFSLILFACGAVFAYVLAIPAALKFLLSFGSEQMIPMITVKNYVSFVGTLMLAFGVVFELPLVLMFLTKIGIATPEFLIQKRKHAIVVLLVLSAIITPPDVISLLIMSAPLLILYEVGILLSKMSFRG